jgi:hypothetical protein
MNRIYIIGNGFDLSHGLPTSYDDFIKYFIKKEVFNLIDNIIKKDKIQIEDFHHQFLGKVNIRNEVINKHFNNYKLCAVDEVISKFILIIKNEIQQDPITKYKYHFSPINEFEFINQIIDFKHFLWGKIEIQYFELLKKYHKEIKPDKSNIEEIKNKVITLNSNLEYIKNELVSYLTHVQNSNTNDYSISEINSILEFSINEKTSENFYKLNKNLDQKINFKMNSYLFLNFNYTDTISYLIKKCNINYNVLNIHGSIKNSNDIIFGFGDENTNEYKDIENSEDVFLENIKSFKYLKNNHYDKLIGFIDNDHYEVYLLGHSCSVTDRVLLKKIFESPYCITIKIIPRYGKDDERYQNYKEICFNIARIFEDNDIMRGKVIPFPNCDVHLPNYDKFEVKI